MTVAKRIALVLLALYVFVLALELIKAGTADVSAVINTLSTRTVFSALGIGSLFSCIVLSGSPVAVIALALIDTLGVEGSFAMIIGSRVGASFVVLAIGFLYDMRQRDGGGVYVGALAFISTATIYLPASLIGYGLLKTGWLHGFDFSWRVSDLSLVNLVIGPVKAPLEAWLPGWALVVVGVLAMVGAFKLFDLALPAVDPTGGKLAQMATTVYRPPIAFLFGMLVTCITLSVSVSLTILVPLTVRGIIRRENLIPYILGANITTFVDTFVASLLLVETPLAPAVVVCCVTAVTLTTLPIVFLTYRPYERLVDRSALFVTSSRRRLVVFLSVLFLIPILLMFLA